MNFIKLRTARCVTLHPLITNVNRIPNSLASITRTLAVRSIRTDYHSSINPNSTYASAGKTNENNTQQTNQLHEAESFLRS